MEYIIIIIGIILFLVIKSVYDKKEKARQLRIRLEVEWGEVPKQEYSEGKFTALRDYFDQTSKGACIIDDITWNDLSMDEIFMLINNTSSAMGEEYLYSLLRKLEFSQDELEKRNALIEYFRTNKEERKNVQLLLSRMGKLNNFSIFRYINRIHEASMSKTWQHIFMAGGLIGSFFLFSVDLGLTFMLIVFFVGLNIITYYKRKAKIDKFYSTLAYIVNMVDSCNELVKLDIPMIKEEQEKLKSRVAHFQSVRKNSNLIMGGNNMSGGLGDIIMDYIRMLFHVDLIKFDLTLATIRKYENELNEIFDIIGYIDSMISIASFRELMGVYCIPELTKDKKPFIEMENGYHPLIDEPVKNTLKEQKSVLITGSNASGKSTFIKTLAINALFAQTIYTCMADSYKASYFKVYSSMALKDDILGNESYYIVEIKSLKRIMNQVKDDYPVLCFVDEVLRGTNTLERIAASAQILYHFATSNAFCFAATHDIELTHILEKYFSNYHFQEEVKDNDVIFDYKLYEGRAISRNAIKLLGIMGYDKGIIEHASNMATNFLENGQWDCFE